MDHPVRETSAIAQTVDELAMTKISRVDELFDGRRVPLPEPLLECGLSAAYIFDVEGTLVDCAPQTLQCWHETLASFGVPVPMVSLQRLSGMDGDEMLATLVPILDESARKKS